MDLAGTAVGIVSVGLQISQGLLRYYGGWKDYPSDVDITYQSIAELSRSLTLLKASLEAEGLDAERTERVRTCLRSCENALTRLSKKLQQVRKHVSPEDLRRKVWSELQRLAYPFRKDTLAKLRDIVNEIQERLKLALQILHLDVSVASQRTLADIQVRLAEVTAQSQRLLATQATDELRRITEWLDPPNPWLTHNSARQRYEAETGTWLFRSDEYQRWKYGPSDHLWLHGKAGTGKTILCSSIIEDLRRVCEFSNIGAIGLAVFYFTFSDSDKQSYTDLIRSLTAQLGWKEPGRSMLQREYENSGRNAPGVDFLESVLNSSIEAYDIVFLVLDALDESPDDDDVRHDVLDGVERLCQCLPNLKIVATSRDVRDVRETMAVLSADSVDIATSAVNADIRRYVSAELLRDRRLRRLDAKMRALVVETISSKADGM